MKKFLVLIMVIFMVFAMVACKSEPEQQQAEMPVEKEQAKDTLIAQGASAKTIDHTGFRIDVTENAGGEIYKISIGGKNDVYWIGAAQGNSPMTTMFYAEKASGGYIYVDGYGWAHLGTDATLKSSLFSDIADSLLFSAYEAQEYLSRGADETVFNRSCATYSASVPVAEGSSQKVAVKFWVDKEYGVTLKLQYEDPQFAESFSLTVDPTFSNPTTPTGYDAAKTAFDAL